MKIAFFDFDGTLLNGETIEHILQDYPDVYEKVKEYNQMGIRGEVEFCELYIKKIQLFRDLPYETILKRLVEPQEYFPGARDLIANLRSNGWVVIILSGGFEPALEVAQKALNFNTYWGNEFVVRPDGTMTGYVRGPCMHQDSKGEIIQKILAMSGAKKEDCMGVGDGRNDVSMFQNVGFSVAFCAKSKALREIATHCVDEPDLNLVWDLMKER